MLLEPVYNSNPMLVQRNNMTSYPSMLTPPSSSEDSPQSIYYVASPTSNSFQGPETYAPQVTGFSIISQPEAIIDPHAIMDTLPRASLHFIEQPTDRFRFRYKSEMAGTHGSLTGMNSDKSRKQTYPTVELKNCTGTAFIRCSIYQVNAKGRDCMPHAHRLIMKKGKEEQDDPHDLVVGPEDDYKAVFHGMGIIHTAKKNIVSELLRKKTQLKKEEIARLEARPRELTTKEVVEIKGLADAESKSINLNIVCLRFDAFIKQNGILYPICEPIYSHGINNLKSALTGDLKIVRLDHCVSPAKGNKEIFILVERVTKKNIKIRFFETDDEDRIIWEDYGKFNDLDVHHQYAIVFKTPKYRDENITKSVNVFIELVRPSDNARSEPRDFRYIPNKSPVMPGQKRKRYDYSSSNYDSSNMGSEELPLVINHLNVEPVINQINPVINVPSGLSEELMKAMNDINSEEFQQLFSENFNDYVSILGTDAPKMPRNRNSVKRSTLVNTRGQNIVIEHEMETPKFSVRTVQKPEKVFIKIEVTAEDKRSAARTIDELRSFVKSTHKINDGQQMLKHHLGENNKTNALHVSVCQNNFDDTLFLLKVIGYYSCFDLINNQNDENQTALHLAIFTRNAIILKCLLKCKATIGILDGDLNTVLHHAVRENVGVEILDLLLQDREYEKIEDYIDLKDKDGNTALFLAIDKHNMTAVKMLCLKGADVNATHDKNGFVPLRLAIEKQDYEIVAYLLSFPGLYPAINDFGNISPLEAAMQKPSKEIVYILRKYINDHHLQVDIKEEVDEESDEEMEDEPDIKPVLISTEELKALYDNVKNFTPQCLDDVSVILDTSGNWESLAELLEIHHMISSGIIQSEKSMSKAVLTYAIETNNDTVWMIRNLLENLDELRAVEIIDRMVQNFN